MRELVVECAIRAPLIAGGTALVLRAAGVKRAASQHAVWTAVVVAMLALPLWMAWGPKAPLRVLPPSGAGATLSTLQVRALSETPAPARAPRGPSWNWWTWLAGVYLTGAATMMTRLSIGTARAHALRRTAVSTEGRLESTRCAAPVTVGWLRPAVILPAGWRAWPEAQLEAVMAHENEHARRRDPLVAWAALFNRAVFWFHPLAWWLERRLATLAEEACDAAVLERGHDRYVYSECLLEMARRVARAGRRANVWGMAMPGNSLGPRVRKIVEGTLAPRMSPARQACAAAACGLMFALFATGAVARKPVMLAQARANAGTLWTVVVDATAVPYAEKTLSTLQAILSRHADDPVSVMWSSGGSVRVRQDFTGDREVVLQTVRDALAEASSQGSQAGSLPERLAALLAAAKLLGPLPGKKGLIYPAAHLPTPADGNQQPVRAVIEEAQRANIVIYAIDVGAGK